MSYELQKPYTDKQKADFIVEYNHKKGLRIEDTGMYLFALEANEMMGEKEIEIEVPDYETVIEEYQEPVYVTVEKEELDEEGNVIGTYTVEELDHYETLTREVEKQVGSHIETKIIPYPVINPNYEAEQAQRERERIAKLSLTKREVFLALYKDKGITPEQIRAQISNPEALIEFDYANDYYRGNPLINVIGQALGYSTEQLDYLFENKQLPEKVDNTEEVEANAEENNKADIDTNTNNDTNTESKE